MKKFLIAVDSFKGSLSAKEISEVLSKELTFSKTILLSDGGEGFIESILDNVKNAQLQKILSFDDLGKKIMVPIATKNSDAYIEVASIVGLHNYPNVSAISKSSYGVGYALQKLVKSNQFKKIYIGLGGSSTSDGGFGAARGFGFKFLDQNRQEIQDFVNASKIRQVLAPQIDSNVTFVGLSDVNNSLLGRKGSNYFFGPQKWMTSKEIASNESNMQAFAKLKPKYIKSRCTGASGGLGYFIKTYLNGSLCSGIKHLIRISNLKTKSISYDYLITGEGKFDKQSFYGKAPIQIAKASQTQNILIAGSIDVARKDLQDYFKHWFAIKNDKEKLEVAIKKTKKSLVLIARKINKL